MAFSAEDRVQRPLNFAIVDEVDSILIDEARTPLIISGGVENSACPCEHGASDDAADVVGMLIRDRLVRAGWHGRSVHAAGDWARSSVRGLAAHESEGNAQSQDRYSRVQRSGISDVLLVWFRVGG